MSLLGRFVISPYVRLRSRLDARRIYRHWMNDAPKDLPSHWRDVNGFESRIRETWRNSLDGLELLWLRAYEEGAAHNKRHRPAAASEQDFLFDALARLHARACRAGSEVLALLRTGHADGAHARWRTLHEIAVTMFFLRSHDASLAEAYLLHRGVIAHRAAAQYQIYHRELGYDPFTQDEMDAMRDARDELVNRFGPAYATDYGWAAAVLGKARPTFRDIEQAIEMERWRPWYRMASEAHHAGSRGLAFTLGLSASDDLLLAGPSNLGLADPGSSTAISLGQATVALLTYPAALRAIGVALAIQRLAREVEADFGAENLRPTADEAELTTSR